MHERIRLPRGTCRYIDFSAGRCCTMIFVVFTIARPILLRDAAYRGHSLISRKTIVICRGCAVYMRCVTFNQVRSEFVIGKQHGFHVHTPTTIVNYDRVHTDFELLSHRWATNGIQVIRLRNERRREADHRVIREMQSIRSSFRQTFSFY